MPTAPPMVKDVLLLSEDDSAVSSGEEEGQLALDSPEVVEVYPLTTEGGVILTDDIEEVGPAYLWL